MTASATATFFHLFERSLRICRLDEADPLCVGPQRCHEFKCVVVTNFSLVIVDEIEEEAECFVFFPVVVVSSVFLHDESFVEWGSDSDLCSIGQ